MRMPPTLLTDLKKSMPPEVMDVVWRIEDQIERGEDFDGDLDLLLRLLQLNNLDALPLVLH